MKIAVIFVAIALTNTFWAANDCAFDQEHQLTVLAAIAKQQPGAQRA